MTDKKTIAANITMLVFGVLQFTLWFLKRGEPVAIVFLVCGFLFMGVGLSYFLRKKKPDNSSISSKPKVYGTYFIILGVVATINWINQGFPVSVLPVRQGGQVVSMVCGLIILGVGFYLILKKKKSDSHL